MGLRERREREKKVMRALILDTARDMFINHGYEQVSMRNLAKKIEYSTTAIYLHFKDKETLFYELCEGDFQELMKSLENFKTVIEPIERLRKMAQSYVEFAIEHPNQYRLLFMTPGSDKIKSTCIGHVSNVDLEAYEALRNTISEAIKGDRFRSGLSNPDMIAQVLFAALHGVVSVHIAKLGEGRIEWQEVSAQSSLLIELILRGAMVSNEMN